MKKSLFVFLVYGWFFAGCTTSTVAPEKKRQDDKPLAADAYFTNPLSDGADPWIIKVNGFYYACGSGKGGIYVSKSAGLTQLGERVVVWRPPASGWNQSNIWAPEIHFLNGRWYIYYAAASKPGGPFLHQRSGVLESATADPFGKYEDKGMLYTGDNILDSTSVKWAIDLSPFRMNGQLYAVWSGWEENNTVTDRTKQHLYMARMSNPYTISSNRVKISSPTEEWETGGELDLNEGPELLRKKEKAFIIYSCRESWLKEYRLAQLTLPDTTLNPMEPGNWKKTGPVFQSTDQVFGVGHCSFTKSPDNTEDWIYYHAKKSTAPGWQREIRLQKFTWKKDGTPDFGQPIASGVPIKLPAGEKAALLLPK